MMIRLEIQSNYEDTEQLIKSAIHSQIKRLEIGINKSNRELKIFEGKYQISSDYFLSEYTAEDLEGGDEEYIT